MVPIKKEDARLFPRVNLRTPVRFQVRGEPKFNHSVCDNISAGGVGFLCDTFLAPATPMMLEINVLSRILRPIGRVVWSQPLAHSDRNRSGVEFLQLDTQEENYLKDFISMQRGEL